MEQLKTNLLQKAALIMGGLLLACGLVFAFAPAKAWAGAIITGVTITGYEAPEAGEWARDNCDKLQRTFSPSAIPVENIGAATGWYKSGTNEQVSKFQAGESYYLGIELFSKDNTESFSDSFNVADVSIFGAVVAKVEKKPYGGIYITTKPYTVPEENEEFTTYKMISGNGATWTKGSTTGLTFVSEAPFDEFHADSVVVDDVALDQKYWTVEAGSTKLTLKPEYLEGLEPRAEGYKLAFSSDNGISNATFYVKAADDKAPGTNDEKTSPKTGVDTFTFAATAVAFAMGAMGAGIYLARSRKESVK